jgi:uncharacterized protein YicC (UPF0701 family)
MNVLRWVFLMSKCNGQNDKIKEALHSYIKAGSVNDTIRIMSSMEQKEIGLDYSRFQSFITYLQSYGLCSDFNNNVWMDFITSKNIVKTMN